MSERNQIPSTADDETDYHPSMRFSNMNSSSSPQSFVQSHDEDSEFHAVGSYQGMHHNLHTETPSQNPFFGTNQRRSARTTGSASTRGGGNSGQSHQEETFETQTSTSTHLSLNSTPLGLQFKPMQTVTSLYCSIPSKPSSNLFGSFGGQATLGNSNRGYIDTTMKLGYNLFLYHPAGAAVNRSEDDLSSKTTLICDWNTKDGISKMSYGFSNQSTKRNAITEVKINYPPSSSPHSSKTHNNTPSLSLRAISDIVTHKLRGDLELNSSLTSKEKLTSLKIGLFTTFDCNKYPYLRFDVNLFNPRDQLPFQVQYSQPTKNTTSSSSSSTSHVEISVATGKNLSKFKFQTLFSQSISKFTTFSTGIQHETYKGLSWILRWEKGKDVVFIVPIYLSSILYPKNNTTFGSELYYHCSVIYFGFLSYVIDSIIKDVIQRKIIGRDDSDINKSTQQKEEEERMISGISGKGKKDAELQMKLMKRKSNLNKVTEEKKSGLVIVKATYGVADECIDVTVPLQFWVMDSKLILTSHPKSRMLGFYDVMQSRGTANSMTNNAETTPYDNKEHGLLSLWHKLFHSETIESKHKEIPTLSIRYRFNGELYDISIMENQSLTLPSPHAKRVIEEVE